MAGYFRDEDVPWRVQPQGAVGIDLGNPLAAGIVMHVPFHPVWGMRDIVKNNPVTKTGLASTNVSSRGIAPLFGASNYADLTDTTGVVNLTDPVTIAWVQKFVSPASSSTVLVWKPSAAARTALVGYQSALSGYRFSFGTSVNEWNLGAVASPVDGEERVCVVVCRAGLESATASDFSIYINGVDRGTPAGTTFGALTTAGMRVGATLAGADPFEGGISRLTIWNRPLLEKEALRWSDNPDGIYQPQIRRIWVPVSAGGGSTGTVAYTNASDTSGANGTTTIVGTLAATNANDAVVASGSAGSGVSGAPATTNANDTSAAAGTTTVTGAVARSNADDSVSASGWAGLISGAVAATNNDDTLEARGTGGVSQDSGSGGWGLPIRRKKKKPDDEELTPEVVEAVAEAPKERRKITLQQLIGKRAAAQVDAAELSQAIRTLRMKKRQRQDDELMMM